MDDANCGVGSGMKVKWVSQDEFLSETEKVLSFIMRRANVLLCENFSQNGQELVKLVFFSTIWNL